MAKFKVGDKVKAKKDAPYVHTTNGWVGTVVSTYGDNMMNVWGYPLLGTPTNSIKGFPVKCEYFDLVQSANTRKIVITTNGKTTTAILYNGKKRVKTAAAVCSPEDTFSLGTGAKLVLDRLFENKTEVSPQA